MTARPGTGEPSRLEAGGVSVGYAYSASGLVFPFLTLGTVP